MNGNHEIGLCLLYYIPSGLHVAQLFVFGRKPVKPVAVFARHYHVVAVSLQKMLEAFGYRQIDFRLFYAAGAADNAAVDSAVPRVYDDGLAYFRNGRHLRSGRIRQHDAAQYYGAHKHKTDNYRFFS